MLNYQRVLRCKNWMEDVNKNNRSLQKSTETQFSWRRKKTISYFQTLFAAVAGMFFNPQAKCSSNSVGP
jgi:hypothetical protein